jgi:hypothetical protein
MNSIAQLILGAYWSLAPMVAQAACTPASGTLCPITAFQSIQTFIVALLQTFVNISLPIIGFFIVLVGYKFIAAQGKPSKLEHAKQEFQYVILGAALIMGAWVLATLIGSTISQLTS